MERHASSLPWQSWPSPATWTARCWSTMRRNVGEGGRMQDSRPVREKISPSRSRGTACRWLAGRFTSHWVHGGRRLPWGHTSTMAPALLSAGIRRRCPKGEWDGDGPAALVTGRERIVQRFQRRAAQTLCYFCFMLRVSSALLIAAGLVAAQDATLHWMPVISPKIDVAGLPWFQENRGEFWRLPARSRDAFPVEVWNLALDPTGGRIRFRTDSSTVSLRLEWPHPPNMRNMLLMAAVGSGPFWRGQGGPRRQRSMAVNGPAGVMEPGTGVLAWFRSIPPGNRA